MMIPHHRKYHWSSGPKRRLLGAAEFLDLELELDSNHDQLMMLKPTISRMKFDFHFLCRWFRHHQPFVLELTGARGCLPSPTKEWKYSPSEYLCAGPEAGPKAVAGHG